MLSITLLAEDNQFEKIDLNNATYDEIKKLPITEHQAQAIFNWLEYIGPFESVYDLLKVDGIDIETFVKLKNLVRITPKILSESERRVEDNYYKIERWISEEGANENIVEEWIEKLSNPINVNSADFFELLNLQGVSPVDANAILERRKRARIKSVRDLRNIENLSYYGYSNLSDFVNFEESPLEKKLQGSFTAIIKNITLSQVPSDDPESYVEFKSLNYPYDSYYRSKLQYGNNFKIGILFHRNMGETDVHTKVFGTKLPSSRKYIELDNLLNKEFLKIKKIIAGDYIATFGQGVVLETNDFFLPRKSGFGWKKRFIGINGNLSRTREYGLTGLAIESEIKHVVNITGFYSISQKDAVVNNDSSFFSLITMYPRLDFGLEGTYPNKFTNSVKEMSLGENIRIKVKDGTYIGSTIYQAYYDRAIRADVRNNLLNESGIPKYLTQIGNSADSEIEANYESEINSSKLWNKAKATRRVLGFDFLSVHKNICFQGEIGFLDKNLNLSNFHNDPKALVLSGYIQFDNFNFLLLYRDYDLEYDNPYQRSFSNYQRFKGSILEDLFYLKDPALGFLYSANPQPQAERGFYIYSRYQISRSLITTIEGDIWTRVADNSKFSRIVLNLEYRPVFRYRFRVRQKFQKRDKSNSLAPVGYDVEETRFEVIMRMSRFNEFRILIATGFTGFTPRPRLVTDPITLSYANVGNAGEENTAFGATISHNFNDRLKLKSSFITYKGFFWNFEDTDFRIFSTDSRAYHGWISLFTRISKNISLRLKYSFDYHAPITNYTGGIVDVDNNYPDYEINEIFSGDFYTDFRIQIDYRLYP